MTKEQLELWHQLNALVAISEQSDDGMFTKRYFNIHGARLAVFDYTLVFAYERFTEAGGHECRGHTFIVDESGEPIKMVCWPLSKFFNLGEDMCPIDGDDNVTIATVKEDGSMIASYLIDDKLLLKTNGSPNSRQCQNALRWLNNQPEQLHVVKTLTEAGYTVCMEWIGPSNRHIVAYAKESLPILAVRRLSDGLWINIHTGDCEIAQLVAPFIVERSPRFEGLPANVVQQEVMYWPASLEGVVIENEYGQTAKIKGLAYTDVSRVVLGGGYRSTRTVYRAIIDNSIDDVIAVVKSGSEELAMILETARTEVLEWKRQQIVEARRLYEEAIAEGITDYKTLNTWADEHIRNDLLSSLFKLIMRGKELHKEFFWMQQYDECSSMMHIRTFADVAARDHDDSGIQWSIGGNS